MTDPTLYKTHFNRLVERTKIIKSRLKYFQTQLDNLNRDLQDIQSKIEALNEKHLSTQ